MYIIVFLAIQFLKSGDKATSHAEYFYVLHSSSNCIVLHFSPICIVLHSSPICIVLHSSPICIVLHCSPICNVLHSSPICIVLHCSPICNVLHSSPICIVLHCSPICMVCVNLQHSRYKYVFSIRLKTLLILIRWLHLIRINRVFSLIENAYL